MKNEAFRKNKKLIISGIGVVLEGLLSGCNFLVLFKVLDLIFKGNVTMNAILQETGILAGIFIVRLLVYMVSYTGCQEGGSDVSKNIRIVIGDKLRRIPLSLFTKNRKGFYINAATSEVGDYEQILTHKIAEIVKYCILVLVVGIYACTLLLRAGIAILISSLLIIPFMAVSIHMVHIYGVKKNRAREENVSSITEYLTGSQTLRSYGLVGMKNETLTGSMKEYSDISYNYEKAVIPVGIGFNYCSFIAFAYCIICSVNAWIQGIIGPSALVLLLMLPLFITKVNMTLFINMTAFRNLKLSKDKILTIFSEKEEPEENKTFSPANTNIEFQNVSYSYVAEEPVLKNISFTIPEHKLTAIVGDSGSGKSTILNLIAKYYTPQQGKILIGNKTINQLSSDLVLSKISQVDQDVFLFNDTVRNNIRYARMNATDIEIEEACKQANCDSFIKNMEHGYETEIGENGNKLSGGERQRLSVARAILKNSPIILLDEATASLDIENELLVKKAIANLLRADKTVIMIAHTLPIVRSADKILVLDNGQICECGTHDELVKNNGKYTSMWRASQNLK